MIPKLNYGRRGLPKDYLAVIVADYRRLRSCRKVAALHGRTRNAIHSILKRRGLTNPRKFREPVIHQGKTFTKDRLGYYCATGQRNPIRYLHHVVWEEHHGPIPTGHVIRFRDRNPSNFAIENLYLQTVHDFRHRPRGNMYTRYWRNFDAAHSRAIAALDRADAGEMKRATDELMVIKRPGFSEKGIERLRNLTRDRMSKRALEAPGESELLAA